ncbi:MAG: VOC family protein [Dehalococcoidia bacterium]|nr:VOC family protein [Dehalococcoidia bacterium]
MLQAQGVGYTAIIVHSLRDSVEFYQRLGLKLVYVEPNRDDLESLCALMYAGGNDSFIMLVGPAEGAQVVIAEAQPGVGSMQYLSFIVSHDTMSEIWHEMSNAGVSGSEEIIRGYERLVFLQDPNGVLVTLTAWSTEPPLEMPRALVLVRAAAIREREGAAFIEDSHIQQAIAELLRDSRGPSNLRPSSNN